MFPLRKFRIGCDSKIKESLRKYIQDKFSLETYNQCEEFINEFYQTRNMVGFMNNNQTSSEQIKIMISNCYTYLKTLDILNQKIRIGNSYDELQINFSWREASCNKETSSKNIYYEICSVKFNIAISYCLLGYLDFKNEDPEKLKESMKNFERACYIFGEVKETSKTYLGTENIPDFSESFLNCCNDYALGLSQICVLKIAIIKNLSKGLISKLSMGVYNLLNQCMNYSITSFSCDKTLPNFLRNYFEAKAYIYKKDFLLIDYDKYAQGLGNILGYSKLALSKLNLCVNDIIKVKTYFDEFKLKNEKSDLEYFIQKYTQLNEKINREKITEESKLPIIEADIKVQPLKVEFTPNPISSIIILNKYLIPNDIKPLVNRYFEDVAKFLNEKLSKFESEKSINEFLENRNLPNALITGISSNTISQNIFDEILSVQNQGGLHYLESQLDKISKESNRMGEKINKLEEKLYEDKQDDDKCRILYGNDNWKRVYNPEFLEKCKSLKENLNIGKNLDFQIRKKILEKTKYYELFSLPKHVIEARIPTNIDQTKLAELSSTQALKFSINKLEQDKLKLSETIKEMFNDLYYNIPIVEFQNVLLNKRTEKLISEDRKKKYESMLEKISEINIMIKTDFIDIESKYNEFANACGDLKHSENEETQQYLFFLSNAKKEFQKHVNNTNNSLIFYENFAKKIEEINQEVDSYLAAREIEKKELIDIICKNERMKFSQNSIKDKEGNVNIKQEQFYNPNSNNSNNNNNNFQNQYDQSMYPNQGNNIQFQNPNQNNNNQTNQNMYYQPYNINPNNMQPGQNYPQNQQNQNFQYSYQYNIQNQNNNQSNNQNYNQNQQLRYSEIFKK